MSTYGELQDKVARALSDPDKEVFVTQTIKDIIAAGWAEVSLVAPERFIEELAPVDDQIAYQLRSDVFPDAPNDDIRLVSVEVWQASPKRPLRQIESAMGSGSLVPSFSESGWRFWGGYLNLPYRWVQFVKDHEDDYLLRVTGYSPWPVLVDDSDDVPFAAGTEEALVAYCNVEGLRRLVNDRNLFTQWALQTNNTDVTQNALRSDLGQAREDWRRLAGKIMVLRGDA